MNSNELVTVLPSAVGKIIQSMYERHPGRQSNVQILLKAHAEFITAVAKKEESQHDTEFWNAITYSYRRGPSQIQFDAIQFHLGICLGNESDDEDEQKMWRFKKREFLKRFFMICLHSLPACSVLNEKELEQWQKTHGDLPDSDCLTDHDLDDVLDLYGECLLSGYKNYRDVIKMKWRNLGYMFPEDVEKQKHVQMRLAIRRQVRQDEEDEEEELDASLPSSVGADA